MAGLVCMPWSLFIHQQTHKGLADAGFVTIHEQNLNPHRLPVPPHSFFPVESVIIDAQGQAVRSGSLQIVRIDCFFKSTLPCLT